MSWLRVTAVSLGLASVLAVPLGCGDRHITTPSDVYFVDPTGSGANGTTWATAFKTVQRAVDIAAAFGGGEVWVAGGIYTNGGGTGSVLEMKENVHVYGGFKGYKDGAGLQETDILQRDYETSMTELNGEGEAYHVVTGANNATLDGFVVRGGAAVGAYPNSQGGGMRNYHCAPTVRNCTFRTNIAYSGGGMFTNWTPVIIDSCTFSNNTALVNGGGVFSNGGPQTITGCTFIRNIAVNRGGGLYCDSATVTLKNCTIIDNAALYEGGGMFARGDYDVPCTIANCTFFRNLARSNGGGMCLVNDALDNITNCIISNNTAVEKGGGIYSYSNVMPIVNATLVDNQAAEGSEIYHNASDIIISNSVVRNNVTVTGSIIYNEGNPMFISYSNIEGCGGSGAGWNASLGTDDGGNIDADPLFVDADGADDIPGTEDDDLRLLAGSPCVDAGDNLAVPADAADLDEDSDTTEPTPLDLDLNDRFVDDPATVDSGNGSPPVIDVGAYEYQP